MNAHRIMKKGIILPTGTNQEKIEMARKSKVEELTDRLKDLEGTTPDAKRGLVFLDMKRASEDVAKLI